MNMLIPVIGIAVIVLAGVFLYLVRTGKVKTGREHIKYEVFVALGVVFLIVGQSTEASGMRNVGFIFILISVIALWDKKRK